jgi:hypothetical protein
MQVSQITPPNTSLPFVMLNATICEPTSEMLRHEGYYDPETQEWNGRIEIGAGTYSQRSTGRTGDYASVSDD